MVHIFHDHMKADVACGWDFHHSFVYSFQYLSSHGLNF
ncbi:unnamed protein product [Ixodes pacificus]